MAIPIELLHRGGESDRSFSRLRFAMNGFSSGERVPISVVPLEHRHEGIRENGLASLNESNRTGAWRRFVLKPATVLDIRLFQLNESPAMDKVPRARVNPRVVVKERDSHGRSADAG